jgi:hypothetical protein
MEEGGFRLVRLELDMGIYYTRLPTTEGGKTPCVFLPTTEVQTAKQLRCLAERH